MTPEQQAAIKAEADRRYPYPERERQNTDYTYSILCEPVDASRKGFKEICDFALSLVPQPTADIQADLKQLFENNFDCYADTGYVYEVIPAMTIEKFVEVVSALIPKPSKDIQADAEREFPYPMQSHWSDKAYKQMKEDINLERAAYIKGRMQQRGWGNATPYPVSHVVFFNAKEGKFLSKNGIEIATEMLMKFDHYLSSEISYVHVADDTLPANP